MKKKTFAALALSAAMFIGGGTIPVSADSVTLPGDYGVPVTCDIPSGYTVTIPKTIALSSSTKSADYTVSISGKIAGDETLSVVPDKSFAMSATGYSDQKATVTQEKTAWSYDELSTKAKGSISAPGIDVGSWKGTLTFHIALSKNS